MSQASSTAGRAEAIRQRTLAALETMTAHARQFELPEPPPVLEQCRHKLQNNAYEILVVGEAKRGKSTFVNALIGRDLLPTDVDVATSQVFRVAPAAAAAYHLRFEDDSRREIAAADLPRFGSQVVADAEGSPRLDQIIRWIEVDVPARFLPANVRLLDTPGLGALYAAHAEITNRFVPRADAVIFVLDSQAPVSEPEVAFLDKILGVTPNVFFIQTKIDQFRKEAWQALQQRDQEILRARFGGRLTDPRVWPISSTNLRKAAQTGDEDYVIVSRHKELAAGLQAFLFRVSGWGRAAEAVQLAQRHHAQCQSVLQQRLGNLVEESKEKRAETQRQGQERRRLFDAEWGPQGQQRRTLQEGIRTAAGLAKQDFRQALQPTGAIETARREAIEKLATMEEAKQYGEALAAQVTEEALAKWRAVGEQFQAQVAKLLAPFLSDLDKVGLGQDNPEADGAPVVGGPTDVTQDGYARFRSTWGDVGVIVGAAGLATGVAGASLAALWFTPVGLVLAGAILWVGIRGWKAAGARQVKEAQGKLKEALGKQLQQLRTHFFDVDQSAGRGSRVEEYFSGAERSLAELLTELAQRKLTETQAELQRLQDQGKLSEEERRAQVEALTRQRAEWDGLGKEIKAIQGELRELERGQTPAQAQN